MKGVRKMEKYSVRDEIALVAGSKEWGDNRKSWLARVSHRVPTVPYRTVKALFYGEITDPNHWAARDIRSAAQLIKARQEASALAVQFQSIAGGLNVRDADFHSEDIAALLSLARRVRSKSSA